MATISGGPGVTYDPDGNEGLPGGPAGPLNPDGTLPSDQVHFGSPGDPAGPLDPSGKIPSSQLPPLDHDVGEANSEAAMLALPVTAPAICIRTDFTPAHVFYLTADPATEIANWTDTGEFGGGAADPTAQVGLTAVNGVLSSYMRSDAAPALSQAIAPTWSALHTFAAGLTSTLAASGSTPSIRANSTNPQVELSFSSGGADAKRWNLQASANTLTLRTLNDAGNASKDILSVTRTANAVTAMAFGNATDNPSHTFLGTGTTTLGGQVIAAGTVSAAVTAARASPTNSGVLMTSAANIADVQFFDSTRTANNRTAEWIFFSGQLQARFKNDAGSSAVTPLAFAGGQAGGITGIESNSGTGTWAHTGPLSTTKAISVITGAATGNKLWLGMYSSGTGHTDAPKTLGAVSTYLQIGGREYGSQGFAGIGFGYVSAPTDNPCVWVGHEEVDTAGNTTGDFVVATRPTTTNVAPTERFRITKLGDVKAPTGYAPATAQSFVTAGTQSVRVVASSAVASSHTGNTLETALAVVTVPANTMGANGVLRINSLWSLTDSANVKTLGMKFNGPAGVNYLNEPFTNVASYREERVIYNRNATNSQVGHATQATFGGFGVSGGAVTTSAVDTTQDVDIVFGVQLANASETVTLEAYTIEVLVP